MSNGFSNEKMLELILERLDRVDEKQDSMLSQISSINANGCAHRKGDSERIDRLESWRDRTVVGVVVTLLTSLGSLIGFLFSQGPNK